METVDLSKIKMKPIHAFEMNMYKAELLATHIKMDFKTSPEICKNIFKEMESLRDPDSYVNQDFPALGETLIKFSNFGILQILKTHQPIVLIVSAFETYLKDRLIYAIENQPKILKRFPEVELKIEDVIENIDDVVNCLAKVVSKKIRIQDIKDVNSTYKEIFGFKPFTKNNKEKLNNIFQARNVIVHRGGFIDKKYISKVNTDQKEGNFFFIEDVLEMIKYIYELVLNIEEKISVKGL